MVNSISPLELKVINEFISIADEFLGEEYQKKISSDENLKEKYKGKIPFVTYTYAPRQEDGHCRSNIELAYALPEEEIIVRFWDGEFHWSSIPKDFIKRFKDKFGIGSK
jgi:hypothetical protein